MSRQPDACFGYLEETVVRTAEIVQRFGKKQWTGQEEKVLEWPGKVLCAGVLGNCPVEAPLREIDPVSFMEEDLILDQLRTLKRRMRVLLSQSFLEACAMTAADAHLHSRMMTPRNASIDINQLLYSSHVFDHAEALSSDLYLRLKDRLNGKLDR